MEHRALSALIIRIAGLLVVVYTIPNAARMFAPLLFSSAAQPLSVWTVALSLILGLLLPVALGVVLMYFPATIISGTLRLRGAETTAEQIKPLQQVAFSAIGLWLALFAIVDASYFYGKTRLYARYVEENAGSVRMPAVLPDDFGGFISCAVQFVIGILLLVGSGGVVDLLARLRGSRQLSGVD